ncbi:hypothetical protein NIES2101_06505 [Calothrix sp. HK-06]|nr:hypothetical protein NIES2101_06505 [Calothrix sp. HK-06]
MSDAEIFLEICYEKEKFNPIYTLHSDMNIKGAFDNHWLRKFLESKIDNHWLSSLRFYVETGKDARSTRCVFHKMSVPQDTRCLFHNLSHTL